MDVNEFDYYLPEELIAQVPLENRSSSKMMVIKKDEKKYLDDNFENIINYLKPGDVLVRNITKVAPVRIYGKKTTGANCEFILLKDLGDDCFECLVRPGSKLKVGTKVIFGNNDLVATVLDILEDGTRKVKFEYVGIFNEILDKIGLMPLPPYIHETLEDKQRYNTVYAKTIGSSAAPTARLHFTDEIFEKLRNKGVKIANVTLHVGIGTFRPVKEEKVENHHMHKEEIFLDEENAKIINDAKEKGNRVIAIGTTSTRVLESIANDEKRVVPAHFLTDIFIYPGYKWKIVDGLITNFHLPKSTLLMLVSSFAGDKSLVLDSYKHAIEQKYRFFSFGDCMLII